MTREFTETTARAEGETEVIPAQLQMARKLLVFIAWFALGCIAFVTLSPIGLRPVVTDNPAYERFAAYAILGVLFGLAYPQRRIWLVISIVVGAAIVLEGLQNLTPDRHGHLPDLLEKASGGLFGALVACAAIKFLLRYSPES